MKKFLLILTVLFSALTGLKAQITTSTISGIVKDDQGPTAGATVVAVHTPTGTRYATVTRGDGRYNFSNVNVGGPYTVTVSFIGYQQQAKEGIFTSLGEDRKADFNLTSASQQLSQVTVRAVRNAVFDRSRVNTTSVMDSAKLAATPALNRNLNDYLKMSPLARVDYLGGISIAGQNNKYNSVSINGAPANDQFGLAATGTNGGQASSSPIPVDAIDQLQVSVSPFDVRYSGFLGGAVNAVTKSGTNQVKGGFSYFFRNQDFAGKTPTDNPAVERTKLSDFSSKTYAVNVGGPIIKNKLFLFVAGEYQKSETPKIFNIADYATPGNATQADIDKLANFLRSTYGYDPGGYQNNAASLDRKALTAKLDWNINNNNHLSVFYNFINAKNVSTSASSRTVINFFNDGILYPNKTHQVTAELKSSFSNKVSNSLLLTYSNVLDDRNGLGQDFPYVQIKDGTKNIYFGTETFSTANQLKQKTYSLINETKLFAGKHTLSLIEDLEYNDYYNLFVRNAFGSYVYNSLGDFYNGAAPSNYSYSYSLVDNVIGDGSAAAATFKTYRFGLALQDKYEIADRTTLLMGLRADLIGYPTKPFVDNYFNSTAAGYISRYYDLEGARAGQMPNSYISLSPRVAINHAFDEERNTQIRGGFGLFQARVTAVTPGGVYSNSGVLIGSSPSQTTGIVRLPNGDPLPFVADPYKQYKAEAFGATAAIPSGELDLMAKKYRAPKAAKFNIALDQKLPWGFTGSIEGNYTLNINQTMYYNVNILPPSGTTTGLGSRPVYTGTKIDFDPSQSGVQNPYGSNVYLVTNGGTPGYAYALSALLAKHFTSGLDVVASYSYTRSKVANEPTSSQNSSQWRYMETAFGKNDVRLSNSDFDFGDNIKVNLSYTKDWFKFGGTTIGLYYTGQAGPRFTYVYKNSILSDDGSTSSNDLIYVPARASELEFKPLTVGDRTYTAAEQAAAFDRYIDNDSYLKKRRGQFAERNGGRLPFVNFIDLHAEQNFFVKAGNSKQHVAISIDINNLTNLLNKKWGRYYFLSNDNYQLLTFAGLDANKTPTYQFNPTVTSAKDNAFTVEDNSMYNSSRWTAQLGLKYFFN